MSTLSTTLEAFRKQSNLILRDDTHAKRRQACWDAIASLLDLEEQLGAQEAALARRPFPAAAPNRDLIRSLRGVVASYDPPVRDDAAELARVEEQRAAVREAEIAADINRVRRRGDTFVCDCDEDLGADWLATGAPPCTNCGGKISEDKRRGGRSRP